jgi:hypothetical protein
MPINGDPGTAVISGNVMFDFDDDFVGRTVPATTQAYIANFRNNVLSFWDSNAAPLTFNGNRVHVNVTFGPVVTGAAGWKLYVGDGTGDLAKTLFAATSVVATQKISFVTYASEVGYMFQGGNAREAAHEFGHMLRLADRYMNGFTWDFKRAVKDRFQRATNPLSRCSSKALNDEAEATVGAPYDAGKNLMSAPGGSGRTVTDRQLGFVFSTSKEPPYPMNGWVFLANDNDKENTPAWIGAGITPLQTGAGVTHMFGANNTEATKCSDLKTAIQFHSFRPRLFGLQYQENKEDKGYLARFLSLRSRQERQDTKAWIRQLSAMNP